MVFYVSIDDYLINWKSIRHLLPDALSCKEGANNYYAYKSYIYNRSLKYGTIYALAKAVL